MSLADSMEITMRHCRRFGWMMLAGLGSALVGCSGDDTNPPVNVLDAGATDATVGDASPIGVPDSGPFANDAETSNDSGADGATDAAMDGASTGGHTVIGLAAGPWHTCAVFADGTAKCWGENVMGNLGDGTSTGPSQCVTVSDAGGTPCSPTPVAVTGLNDAVAIAAGDAFACAVRKTGGVVCWGENSAGQLGTASTGPSMCGSTACSPTPVAVNGLTGVAAISAGEAHVCALLTGGTVTCWGRNNFGQLGNGTTTTSSMPVAVPNLTQVASIASGDSQTCARLTDGTVKCWGENSLGQLGIGSTSGPDTCNGAPCATAPVAVTGLTGVSAVAGGVLGMCALVGDGGVSCWGDNTQGRHGDGTTTASNAPVAATGFVGATALTMGSAGACVILSGGTVSCWGDNEDGELGDGMLTGPEACPGGSCSTTAVAVTGLAGVTSLATSYAPLHMCAIVGDGGVSCWGDDAYGELGNGAPGPQSCTGYGTATACSTTPVGVSGL